MNRQNGNKWLALLAAFALSLSIALPALAAPEESVPVESAPVESTPVESIPEENMETVSIYTSEDLASLSQQCSIDTWSQNKRVVLETDLNLSDSGFEPIRTFGGVFDGQGHTISGFTLTGSGNVRGFFRYIQRNAEVKDLIVTGTVIPAGQKDTIGGLVGENRGKILNCAFDGSVTGGSSVGGLAGLNAGTGQIINSSFTGSVTAEHYVGGITGQNLGSLVQCRNAGNINTTEVKTSVELQDVSLGSLRSTENAPAATDIGGIAGASSGILQTCENTGDVGYEHLGYNVGGIVGRQSGWLDSCTNSGRIRGRKDVGGVAGQMEPHLTIQYSPDTLNKLWDELNHLQTLVNTAISHAEGSSQSLQTQMTALTDSAGHAKDAASNLVDTVSGWADDTIEEVNDVTARLSWTLEQLKPVTNDLEGAMELFQQMGSQFSQAIDEAKSAGDAAEGATDALRAAVDHLGSAATEAKTSLEHMNAALEQLRQGIGDEDAISAALDSLSAAFQEMAGSLSGIGTSLGTTLGVLDDAAEWVEKDPDWDAFRDTVPELHAAVGEMSTAIDEISAAVNTIPDDTLDSSRLDPLQSALADFVDSAKHLTALQGSLQTTIDTMEDSTTLSTLSDAVDDLRAAGDAFEQGRKQIQAIDDSLQEGDKLKDDFRDMEHSVDDIDEAMSDLRTALQNLEQALKGVDLSALSLDVDLALRTHLDLVHTVTIEIRSLLVRILEALKHWKDGTQGEDSLSQLLKDLSELFRRTSTILGDLTTQIEGKLSPELGGDWNAVLQSLREIAGTAEDLASAFDKFNAALEKIAGDSLTDENHDQFRAALDNFRAVLDHLSDAQDDLQITVDGLLNNASTLKGALVDSMKELNAALDEATQAKEAVENALDDLRNHGEDVELGLQNVSQALSIFDEAVGNANHAAQNMSDVLERLHNSNVPENTFQDVQTQVRNMEGYLSELSHASDTLKDGIQKIEDTADLSHIDDSMDELLTAVDGLRTGGDALSQSVDSLRQGLDTLEKGKEPLENAGDSLNQAVGTLESACQLLYTAALTAGDVIRELADKPAIRFQPLGEQATSQADALDNAMDSLTNTMEGLNNVLSNFSDVLLQDLQAINTQFGVILDVLRDSIEEEREEVSEEERMEDVSEEVPENDMNIGRITSSWNHARIEGDVNVAGIVGSMALEFDYDPEDDLTKRGEQSLKFHYQIAAMTSECVNDGEISGKKNYVGGIVGRMDLGSVTSCEGYGNVESISGDYVGGIAGASWSAIRDSWARCALSGGDYVGGVAGLGKTVTGCRTLIEIDAGDSCLGTIAGFLEPDGEVSGNSFAHEKLGGIDDISYTGLAEPVPFETLLTYGAPDRFSQFQLTFLADGQVIDTISFQYGGSLETLPEIPAKEGYTAKWPELDYSHLTFSRALEAEYTAYSSALTDGKDFPEILVDGTFSEAAVMDCHSGDGSWRDAHNVSHSGVIHSVEIVDPVLTVSSFRVHYKRSSKEADPILWLHAAEGWRQVEATTDGNYLVFPCEGNRIEFAVVEQPEDHAVMVAILATVGVSAALAIPFLTGKRRNPRKKRKVKGKEKVKTK